MRCRESNPRGLKHKNMQSTCQDSAAMLAAQLGLKHIGALI